MDIVHIEPNMLKGTVKVPPSKSIAHRAILSAALSKGDCCIKNVAMSKDIQATLGCVESLGAKVCLDEAKGEVFLSWNQGEELPEVLTLDCGESGSTLRFLMPLALLTGRKVTLTGRGRLMQRPQKPYLDLFSQKGVVCVQQGDSISLQLSLIHI